MISKVLQNQDENNQQHSRLLYSMGERRTSQRKSCGSHQMAFSTSSSDLLITNRLLPKRHSSLSDTSQIKISNNSTCTFLYNKEQQQQECDKQQQRNSSASSSRRGGYWRKVMPDYHDSNMIPSLNDCLSLSPFRSSNNQHQQQQIWYGGRQKETYEELDHVLERYEKKQQQHRGDSLWCNVADVCAEETSSIGTTWEEEEEEDKKKKLVIALCDGAGNFLSVPDANDSPMNNFTSLVPIKSPRQLSNGEDKSNSTSKEKSTTKNKKRPKSCKHRRKTGKKSVRSRSSMFAISQPCSTTTDDSDDLMTNNNSSKRCSTPASCSRYDVQGMQVGEEWDPHQLTTQVQALGLSRGIMSDDDSSDNIVISVVSKPRPLPRHRALIRPTSSTARLSTATITNNNNQQQRRQQLAAVSLYELPTQQETETTTNVPAASLVANITNKIKQQAATVTSQQQQNNRIQPQPQLLVRPLSSRTRRIPVQIIEDPFKRIVPPPNWTNVEQQKVVTGGRGRSKRNVGGGSRNLNKRPMTAPTTNFSNTPPFSTHVSIIKL